MVNCLLGSHPTHSYITVNIYGNYIYTSYVFQAYDLWPCKKYVTVLFSYRYQSFEGCISLNLLDHEYI